MSKNKYSNFVFVALLSILLFSFAHKAFAVTFVDAEIIEDTTWTKAESPYIIVERDTYIPPDVTLTILPGAVIKFKENKSLLVEGKINAEGTGAEPIYFTSIYDDEVPGEDADDQEDCLEEIDEEGNVLGEICE